MIEFHIILDRDNKYNISKAICLFYATTSFIKKSLYIQKDVKTTWFHLNLSNTKTQVYLCQTSSGDKGTTLLCLHKIKEVVLSSLIALFPPTSALS
ncbi:hypothetical protein SaSA20_0587a [Streptococcus agalactiae]|nr:hypothetical protein SaSA20_0587a [Streptococcus agalactiae]